ncbi:Arylsulfatase B [Mizuhopecten yessoensis]|uniref:Arylsulfatase B n=1 Tax=Mizuhopecten yessoensis TaxID=6573 RepID=A0A210Q257_MIZYE|nr:Arylsulfatase B [Mizuhopecten yessoensis]
MVTAMDDLVGNVTAALKENGMYDDTLFVFTADIEWGWPLFHGNNYPLRGGKITKYEGGTRATAFISGKGRGKTDIHITGQIKLILQTDMFEDTVTKYNTIVIWAIS